jgi:hypothetical protein
VDDIAATLRHLRSDFPTEAQKLQDLFYELRQCADGEVVHVAQKITALGWDLEDALRRQSDWPQETVNIARELVGLRHNAVTVRHRNKQTREGPVHIVGHVDFLPVDLPPMIILDASARIRHTYRLWEVHRRNLRRLKVATKDYSNLTIHWWDKGGGRSTIESNPSEYVEAISDLIASEGANPWLIIHHKPNDDDNLQTHLKEALDPHHWPNLHFVTWGQHTATNDFADIPNIILAGTLFYAGPAYEAHARAASGVSAAMCPIPNSTITTMKLAESLHHILQAACRGAVRKMNGEIVPCHVYLIAAGRHRIHQNLTKVFPGASVVEWNPSRYPISGRAKELTSFLAKQFSEDSMATVRFRTIARVLGMQSPQLSALRKHPKVLNWLENNNIEPCGGRVRVTGYRKKETDIHSVMGVEFFDDLHPFGMSIPEQHPHIPVPLMRIASGTEEVR